MRMVIVIVSIIGLSAVAGAIVIGQLSRDAVVVEQPYETGLKWDEMRREREELGWSLNMKDEPRSMGANTIVFTVLGADGLPLELAASEVTVWASRPAGSAPDVSARLNMLGGPLMAASLALPQVGLWDINVRVSHGGRSMSLVKRVYAEGGAN